MKAISRRTALHLQSGAAFAAEQIAHLSQAFELFPGDIICSGTPEKVGPVVPGDGMLGYIDGLPAISVKVV